MNLGELQDKGLALSTGNYVLDNKLLVMQNLNVGCNVSGQKWTGSLANAGRFGFALSGVKSLTECFPCCKIKLLVAM